MSFGKCRKNWHMILTWFFFSSTINSICLLPRVLRVWWQLRSHRFGHVFSWASRTCNWIGCMQLHPYSRYECVCSWCPVMNWYNIRGVFLPNTKRKSYRRLIHESVLCIILGYVQSKCHEVLNFMFYCGVKSHVKRSARYLTTPM